MKRRLIVILIILLLVVFVSVEENTQADVSVLSTDKVTITIYEDETCDVIISRMHVYGPIEWIKGDKRVDNNSNDHSVGKGLSSISFYPITQQYKPYQKRSGDYEREAVVIKFPSKYHFELDTWK